MATDEAIESVLRLFEVDTLKKEQKELLSCIIEGLDCLAILPTGFGKSLPYQMAVSVLREVAIASGSVFAKKIIVCCPLIALMKDQVERLRNIPGIRAVYQDGSPETDAAIQHGCFDYLFAPPELLVGDESFRELLGKFDVATIVVDEFHTIACW
ncbi:ATP-dependent DNA helicase RecQ-like [Argopecten irradians]|uniref:ATP-dependent DNA helicase RecQ-like n=1 Tax=Argopecten irradians TaxID=31199 RepID=UPI00371534DE